MPPELLTLRDFLRWAVSRFNAAGLVYGHGTTNALDEAAFMVLEGLHLPIDRLEPFLDARLLADERQRLADLIEARVTTRKPAAYLLGKAYIKGIPFHVDERVIVPRSFIGELLFSELFDGQSQMLIHDPAEIGSVLDLCTGSASLAVCAAHVFPHATIDAVDLSPDALEVAKRNVEESALADRLTLFHGDLFAPPEYLAEPRMALASGEDGLDITRRILREAGAHLTGTGGLLCETGTGREILEAEFPHLPFMWLDTEESAGEVFWLSAEALQG